MALPLRSVLASSFRLPPDPVIQMTYVSKYFNLAQNPPLPPERRYDKFMNQETALPPVPVLTDEEFFALLADAETVQGEVRLPVPQGTVYPLYF